MSSLAKKINDAIPYIAIGAGVFMVARTVAAAVERRQGTNGIGKVERIKRRIYKEVSMAQDAGVDFSKKYAELTGAELDALQRVGERVGWKQTKRSIESGKPYTESYFGSLRRAWNAVSGCRGIGATSYNVRNANGDVVLTWTDVTDHIAHEPEAKVLLALPPHVEQPKPKARKTKKAKAKDEEYWERFSFAKDFFDFGTRYKDLSEQKLHKQHYRGTWDIDEVPDDVLTGIIVTFARNELKITKDGHLWFCGEKFSTDGGAGAIERPVLELLEAWNNHYIDKGFQRDDLDEIRRELLDRAKLMQVVINPYKEYEDKTHEVEYFNSDWGRKATKKIHDYGDVVTGDERNNYLDKINYVVFVSQRAGNTTAERVHYPIRSYPDYEGAECFVLNKYGKSGATILPVWDVPIEKITGVSGIYGI